MKTNRLLVAVVLLLCGILTLPSCVSVSGFHTGRTIEEKSGEISLGLNLTRSPDFFNDTEEDIPNVFFPILELGGRYGVAKNIDVGLRVNSALNFLIDGKFQVVGDQESEFAVALGAGFGGFGIVSSAGALLNFQVPVYTSFHPKENIHIYFSPRYIGQFGTTIGESTGLINYLGGNTGVLFGTKTKFGIDLGVFNISENGDNINTTLINIGFGVTHAF